MEPIVGSLTWPDLLVFVGYLVVLIGVGIWSSLERKSSKGVGGYFLAGRSMRYLPVGASLFASNIGSGHFVGLAGSAAAGGVAITLFEISGVTTLIALGWLFVPVYVSCGVFTMPEYISKRFGGNVLRMYLAGLALILYICTKISADLYAGSVFIEQAMNLNIYWSLAMLLIISGAFAAIGGMTAVIWTDFLQTILMVFGALWLSITSFVKIGGFDNMVIQYFAAIPGTTRVVQGEIHAALSNSDAKVGMMDGNLSSLTCSVPPANAFHFVRSASDTSYPFPGMHFGMIVANVWYWCTDQVIVQRTLSAKTLTHAKGGCVVAGFLKLLPLFVLVLPGMISRAIFQDTIACSKGKACESICKKKTGCTDIAYPLLVMKLMPVGVRGLMLACMIASLVSSLTSIFSSVSILFSMDIWRYIRPKASGQELIAVGRFCTIVLILISLAWISVIQLATELFHYIQAVTSYLAPPICSLFLLAVFWERCNRKGAISGVAVGTAIGLIRFVWQLSFPALACGSSEARSLGRRMVEDVHYLHFAIILLSISLATTYTVSILTAPLPPEYSHGLTYWTRHVNRVVKTNGDDRRPTGTSGQALESIAVWDEEQKPETPKPATDEPNQAANTRWYVTVLKFICRIDSSPEKKTVVEELNIDISEDPKMKRITDIAALILLACIAFCYGFFS